MGMLMMFVVRVCVQMRLARGCGRARDDLNMNPYAKLHQRRRAIYDCRETTLG
jgi:hypothetical protein